MALTDTQYDEIMLMYDRRQKENRILMEQRRDEIYSTLPRIAEIDREIASSSIQAARAGLRGSPGTANTAKERNSTLLDEKERLLAEHGYPADYLKPIYTCPLCHDTGRTGQAYCSCFKQAAISILYRQSTLERILETENFDRFELDYYPKQADAAHTFTSYDQMRNILHKTKKFTEAFDKEGGNLLFYGETGLGKTFLSNCIAKALLDTGHTVLYQSAIHLFEEVCADVRMKKNLRPDSQDTYRYLYDCDLLIIDDLGTEYTNSFVSSELYDILNTRMRAGKSTIISTNLNLQELTDRYSDRITTRIFAEYKVFSFYGENIRLAKRRRSIQNGKSNYSAGAEQLRSG